MLCSRNTIFGKCNILQFGLKKQNKTKTNCAPSCSLVFNSKTSPKFQEQKTKTKNTWPAWSNHFAHIVGILWIHNWVLTIELLHLVSTEVCYHCVNIYKYTHNASCVQTTNPGNLLAQGLSVTSCVLPICLYYTCVCVFRCGEFPLGMNTPLVDTSLYLSLIHLSGNEALNSHICTNKSYSLSKTLSPIKTNELHQLRSGFPDWNVLKGLAHNIPKQLIYKKGFWYLSEYTTSLFSLYN